MPIIINPKKSKLESNNSPISEYSWKSSGNLGKELNLQDMNCNIRSLEKGKYSYPYHYHHNSEELFVIISGKGELRTPTGIKKVNKGEIVLFEKGKSGAHQLYNPNSEPLIYMDLRTINKIDVCEYPDSKKVNILPKQEIHYKGDIVEYFEGEDKIKGIWDSIKKDASDLPF